MQKSRGRLARLLVGAAVIAATGMTVPTAATAAPAGTTGPTETYLVLFKGSSSPANAAAIVTAAGGTVVADYSKIGVLVASSGNTAFDDTARREQQGRGRLGDHRLRHPARRRAEVGRRRAQPGDLPNAPATDADTFSPLQWDMRQMHTPEAHAITGGSPAVVAGTIDTGVDYRHPDLRANISDADSANCLTRCAGPGRGRGRRRQRARHAHRRHDRRGRRTASGIVGVAPEREGRRHQGRQRRRATSSPRRSSARSCGPVTGTSTSSTTATSSTRSSSTAATTRRSGPSGRPSSAPSGTP